MSAVKVLQTSGEPSFDQAALDALTNSRFRPLPDDYGPPQLKLVMIIDTRNGSPQK